MRKKLAHDYLKKKLISLWKPIEDLILIDLGHDYYIVKFLKEDNMNTALHKGLWFINGFYLSIRKWHPNFIPFEAVETLSAIWIRLPKIPTKYYDHTILSKIGSKLGNLVKTNICTSLSLCELYAHICIEVPIGVTVKSYIFIGHLKKKSLWRSRPLMQIMWLYRSHSAKLPLRPISQRTSRTRTKEKSSYGKANEEVQ